VFELCNVDTLFFKLGWDRCGIDKKRTGTRYTELLFLYLVGYAGHVVQSGASGPRNIDTLFFMLGTNSLKSAPKHVTLNLCFCIQWDLLFT
jgi:hypothetical protein